jgi:hypothetical protein
LHHAAQKVALVRNEQSLISDEKALLSQADSKKAFGSTLNERKQMSTKTSIKRIALVAVSALGFGLISVVPAKAAPGEASAVTDLDGIFVNAVAGNYQLVQREDVAFSVSVGIDVAAGIGAEEGVTLKAVFTSKPTASTLVQVASTSGTFTDNDNANNLNSTSVDGDGTTPASLQMWPDANDTLADDNTTGTFDFTPDVPGTYSVRVWHDQDADGFYDAGTEKTRTITVIAGGTPASLTVTTYAALSTVTDANVLDANEDGSLIKLLLKDSAGNATKLAAGEGITVSGTNSVTLNGAADSITLTSATTQDISGDMIVNVKKAAAGTSVVTISAAGTIASAFASQTTNLEFVAVVSDETMTPVINETTGVNATAFGAGNAPTAVAASTAKTSIALKLTSAAGGTSRYVAMNLVDTTGAITGYAGANYTQAVSISDTAAGTSAASIAAATWSATTRAATGATGADAYTLYFLESVANVANINGSVGITVTATTAAASAANSSWNISTVSGVSGGSVALELTCKDQFSTAMSGQAVVFSIAGRNAAITTGLNAVTNSSGVAAFSYTDTGTATSAATDTVSATCAGTGVTATVSVSFNADNAVSTVTVSGGNTSAGVTAATVTRVDIAAGTAGAAGARALAANAITATVKSASGALLAGVPVTFTITGTGAAIPSSQVTKYTNNSGVATSQAYGWIAGTYTYTATAGGKSGTGTITFAQTEATEARKITASVSGPIVTAKVVDRFGNPVPLVTVYATKTGTGYFGDGKLKTSGQTDTNGEISFAVAGGDADVTVATYDITDVTAKGAGQTCSRAGTASCGDTAADDTAFTTYAAGTTTTAETGVGNNVAAYTEAGVSKVTVSVTGINAAVDAATEAAVEATDAANSAYEAAVVATETAEAAVAAAEEAKAAADAATAAVEALATEVSTLLAGLKTQLTTLTNTVAKILRRVKA